MSDNSSTKEEPVFWPSVGVVFACIVLLAAVLSTIGQTHGATLSYFHAAAWAGACVAFFVGSLMSSRSWILRTGFGTLLTFCAAISLYKLLEPNTCAFTMYVWMVERIGTIECWDPWSDFVASLLPAALMASNIGFALALWRRELGTISASIALNTSIAVWILFYYL